MSDLAPQSPLPARPAPPLRDQIHHYPATPIDRRRGRDGVALTLRPVLPQDDLLLAELVDGLSPAARRHRFHGAVLDSNRPRRFSGRCCCPAAPCRCRP